MADKYMGQCPNLSVIRELHVKTPIRNHLISTRGPKLRMED